MTRRAVIALRIAVALLLVLAIAIVLAHRYRNTIALEVANSALAGTGVTVRDASIAALGTDDVMFSMIRLELDGGTGLRIEDITLPVRFRGFAGSEIRVGTVTVLPAGTGSDPLPLAVALRGWLDAPLSVPGVTVTVGRLVHPDFPTLRDLTWRADPAWAELSATAEPYTLNTAAGPGVDADYRASLQLRRGGDEALGADLRIRFGDNGSADVAGDLDARLAPLLTLLEAAGALPDGLADLDATLRGSFTTTLSADPVDDTAVELRLRLEDGLEATYRTQTGDPLTRVDVGPSGPVEAQFRYPAMTWTATAEKAQMRVTDDRFGKLPVSLDGLTCESGLRCRFGLATTLEIPAAGEWAAVSATVDARSVDFTAGDGLWRMRTDDLRITLKNPAWGEYRLVAPTLRGGLDASGDALKSTFGITTPDNGLRANVALEYSIATGNGEFRVGEGEWSLEALPPSRLFRQWDRAWDLSAGSARFSGSLRFHINGEATYRGTFAIRADRLAGRYDDIAFVGLTTAFDIGLDSAAEPVASRAAIEVDLIDVGFAIEDLRAQVSPDLPELAVDVTGLTMSTLGGKVEAEPFRYDTDATGNRVVFRLASIQLPLIVGLADLEAVDVTGSVSGTLPVTLAGSKISIEGGRIGNDAPGGVIRYRAGGPVGDDRSQLGIVTRTLRNFEYEALSSEVSYTEAGDLKLQMRLTGVNPDVDATQPVILNLGVEDNIPQLLRSLQAARSIEDILEKRYSR